MPGYVIHLSTAYVHLRTQCDVRDAGAFLRGVIAPDLLQPKAASHFGDDTTNPGLDLFANAHDISNGLIGKRLMLLMCCIMATGVPD